MPTIDGRYDDDGYVVVRECVSAAVAGALLKRIQKDSMVHFVPEKSTSGTNMLKHERFELYGNDYPPLQTFLWGMTGLMEQIVGRDLLPTFDFFRLYAAGDTCRVHRDRPACEHSLSLTLAYSDGLAWPLELGTAEPRPQANAQGAYTEDFSGEESRSFSLNVGDGLAYRGPLYRHGRTTPNPNRWSAHLFLFWVERDGPFVDQAFDGRADDKAVDFTFY